MGPSTKLSAPLQRVPGSDRPKGRRLTRSTQMQLLSNFLLPRDDRTRTRLNQHHEPSDSFAVPPPTLPFSVSEWEGDQWSGETNATRRISMFPPSRPDDRFFLRFVAREDILTANRVDRRFGSAATGDDGSTVQPASGEGVRLRFLRRR